MFLFILQIPDQWENVGHFLEISDDKIQSFKCDVHNNGEPRNFFKSVLVEWEKSKTVPYNWATLLKCISSDAIGNVTLANEIAKDLASSERGQLDTCTSSLYIFTTQKIN